MTKFVLFDIDGTLIGSDGASNRALDRALTKLTGVKEGFRGISFAGKTDLQIVREGLKSLGLSQSGDLPHAIINLYLSYLSGELSNGAGHVKVGVWEILQILSDTEDVHLGLLTGNFKKGAELKLGQFGLMEFFQVGAFGSDSEDRHELLPIAVLRLREIENVSLAYDHCVVIGDTPRDVECARVHGASSIAVATGPYSVEQLNKTEANHVVSDLSNSDQIVQLIINL
ncbi:MAG: HAD hydrolase-like protein [Syntrophobacterales bacterium]|jgi:phosphoglycolate phosphatase-like HAD superfamily hydrolase